MFYGDDKTKQTQKALYCPTPEIKRGKAVYRAYRKLLLERKKQQIPALPSRPEEMGEFG